jgi:hemerythrin-like metal-binding protein
MPNVEPNANIRRSRETAYTDGQPIITAAEHIGSLDSRNRTLQRLLDEHDAIEDLLKSLWKTALSGAGRLEIIEILDIAIAFCETHFKEEEEFMRTSGNANIEAHTAEHKHLLATVVAARQSASGPGLSMAVLDAADLLYDFHEHVRTYDRHFPENQPPE